MGQRKLGAGRGRPKSKMGYLLEKDQVPLPQGEEMEMCIQRECRNEVAELQHLRELLAAHLDPGRILELTRLEASVRKRE